MKSVKLAYEELGNHNNPIVIILHGFFASSRNWRQMGKKFAENYHVYLLDSRNHGSSPHNTEMDYPLMAEDLKHFMDDHEIQAANILGHSMGGKVAMWFAMNYPERIQNLIVADISPVTYQHNFDRTILALKSIPFEQISNRKQADDYLLTLIPELSYRQFLLQNMQLKDGEYSWRVDLEIFEKTAMNIVVFPSIDGLSSFNDKALFIMGGNSAYLDKQAIYTSFPNARLVILQDANHWLHVDQPDAFYTQITEFIDN